MSSTHLCVGVLTRTRKDSRREVVNPYQLETPSRAIPILDGGSIRYQKILIAVEVRKFKLKVDFFI